jgi:uncharacterized membrane protein
MVKTIGNPLSWSARALMGTGRTLGIVAETLGSEAVTPPRIKRISVADIGPILRRGIEDFAHFRSDVMTIVAIYPIVGLVLAVFAFDRGLLPLIFPLIAGFALVGPIAATALYEMSRQREQGTSTGWASALDAIHAYTVAPVMLLGLYLFGIFVMWLFAAQAIYAWTLGPEPPASLWSFARDVLTTANGWLMIVTGFAVGFGFAAVVLLISIVSFPMLIDRRAGVPLAVATSLRVAQVNPLPVAVWGLIVAVSLAIGALPLLLGLVLVLPILGHGTWHFYRATVEWPEDEPAQAPLS